MLCRKLLVGSAFAIGETSAIKVGETLNEACLYRHLARMGRGRGEWFRGRSAGQNLIDSSREILEGVGVLRLSTGLFGDAPTLVTDVVQRLHDGGPVVGAFQEFDAETGSAALLHGEVAAVFLEVEPGDAGPERLDPIERITVPDDVADVEVP